MPRHLLLLAAAAAGSAAAIEITIDASHVLHEANPMYMGCHSDSGFVHEVTGWSSQMLFGEMFERPPNTTTPGQSSYAWQHVVDKALGSRATIATDPAQNFSVSETSAGWPSQRISVAAGPAGGAAGLANRGLGNEGLYLKKGMEYEVNHPQCTMSLDMSRPFPDAPRFQQTQRTLRGVFRGTSSPPVRCCPGWRFLQPFR